MKERRLAKNAKNGMVKSANKMIGNNPKLSSFFLTKLNVCLIARTSDTRAQNIDDDSLLAIT